MAVLIPLRITTAVIGLLAGYYAGVLLEYRYKSNSSLLQFIDIINQAGEYGDCLPDSDDDFDPSTYYGDFVIDSDEETDQSEE